MYISYPMQRDIGLTVISETEIRVNQKTSYIVTVWLWLTHTKAPTQPQLVNCI